MKQQIYYSKFVYLFSIYFFTVDFQDNCKADGVLELILLLKLLYVSDEQVEQADKFN